MYDIEKSQLNKLLEINDLDIWEIYDILML